MSSSYSLPSVLGMWGWRTHVAWLCSDGSDVTGGASAQSLTLAPVCPSLSPQSQPIIITSTTKYFLSTSSKIFFVSKKQNNICQNRKKYFRAIFLSVTALSMITVPNLDCKCEWGMVYYWVNTAQYCHLFTRQCLEEDTAAVRCWYQERQATNNSSVPREAPSTFSAVCPPDKTGNSG